MFHRRFADNILLSLSDTHDMLGVATELYVEGKDETEINRNQGWLIWSSCKWFDSQSNDISNSVIAANCCT